MGLSRPASVIGGAASRPANVVGGAAWRPANVVVGAASRPMLVVRRLFGGACVDNGRSGRAKYIDCGQLPVY